MSSARRVCVSGLVEDIAYLVVLSKDDTRERVCPVGSTFRCFLVATDHEVSVTERQQQGMDLYSQIQDPYSLRGKYYE